MRQKNFCWADVTLISRTPPAAGCSDGLIRLAIRSHLGGSSNTEGVGVVARGLKGAHGGCRLEDEGKLGSGDRRFVGVCEEGAGVNPSFFQVVLDGCNRTIWRGGISVDFDGWSGSMAVLVLFEPEGEVIMRQIQLGDLKEIMWISSQGNFSGPQTCVESKKEYGSP